MIGLRLVGESEHRSAECRSHREHLTLLAAVQADRERSGNEVVRVRMTVGEMKAAIADRGLENTPGNRAAVIGWKLTESAA